MFCLCLAKIRTVVGPRGLRVANVVDQTTFAPCCEDSGEANDHNRDRTHNEQHGKFPGTLGRILQKFSQRQFVLVASK